MAMRSYTLGQAGTTMQYQPSMVSRTYASSSVEHFNEMRYQSSVMTMPSLPAPAPVQMLQRPTALSSNGKHDGLLKAGQSQAFLDQIASIFKEDAWTDSGRTNGETCGLGCKYGARYGTEAFSASAVMQLLEEAKDMLAQRPSLEEVNVAANATFTIVGDTHGQLEDVLWLFLSRGAPSSTNQYLFNGDIVDRGGHSLEILLLLFTFMRDAPSSVIIHRGNHEDIMTCSKYGFRAELQNKFPLEGGIIFHKFESSIFTLFPLASFVHTQKYNCFVVHGGIPANTPIAMQDIKNINRNRESFGGGAMDAAGSIMYNLLWNDPTDDLQKRGTPGRGGYPSAFFGEEDTFKFCELNKVKYIVRSHDVPKTRRGVGQHHRGCCVTVFSASNYTGNQGNVGGVLICSNNGEIPNVYEYMSPALRDLANVWALESAKRVPIIDVRNKQVIEYVQSMEAQAKAAAAPAPGQSGYNSSNAAVPPGQSTPQPQSRTSAPPPYPQEQLARTRSITQDESQATATARAVAPAPAVTPAPTPAAATAPAPPVASAQAPKYAKGEAVEVWSNTASAWVKAKIVETFLADREEDGFKVNAGMTKVIYDANGMVKFIPRELEQTIRKAAAQDAQTKTVPVPQVVQGDAGSPSGYIMPPIAQHDSQDHFQLQQDVTMQVVRFLMEKIVEAKEALFEAFAKEDETLKTGTVSKEVWKKTLCEVLSPTCEGLLNAELLDQLHTTWQLSDPVKYVQFLHRFQIGTQQLLTNYKGVLETVHSQHMDVSESQLQRVLDPNNDKSVSLTEFVTFLRCCQIQISFFLAAVIHTTMCRHLDKTLLSSDDVMMCIAVMAHGQKNHNDFAEFVGKELQNEPHSLAQVFRTWDANNSGFLSRQELTNGIKLLPGAAAREISEKDIEDLMKLMEEGGVRNNRINVLEFLSTVVPRDFALALNMAMSEQLLIDIWTARDPLTVAIIQLYDRQLSNKVQKSEFEDCLTRLPGLASSDDKALNDLKVKAIVEVAANGQAVVEYEKFFKSLQIVDIFTNPRRESVRRTFSAASQ